MKQYKDLYGMWYVATQLSNFSKDACKEVITLNLKYTKWFKTFKKNIEQWMQNASPAEWVKLEAQDPYGFLKKANFSLTMNQLIGGGFR